MKTFLIPVKWVSYGTVEVEANTLEEAMAYAKANKNELPLPDDREYVEGTYEINEDEDFIKWLNRNVK